MNVIRRGQVSGLFVEREEEEIAAIVWAGLHGMASLLQLKHGHQDLIDRPVGKAINFLFEEQDQALKFFIALRSQIVPSPSRYHCYNDGQDNNRSKSH